MFEVDETVTVTLDDGVLVVVDELVFVDIWCCVFVTLVTDPPVNLGGKLSSADEEPEGRATYYVGLLKKDLHRTLVYIK